MGKKPQKSAKKVNTQIISILVLLILLAIIPVTVFLSGQTQDIRQHAHSAVSPTMAIGIPQLSIFPQSLLVYKGDSFISEVTLSPRSNIITSVVMTVTYDPKILSLVRFTPSPDTRLLNETIDIIQGNLTYKEAFLSQSTQESDISLGNITFVAKTLGSSYVGFTNISLTTPGSITTLPNSRAGNYIVSSKPLPRKRLLP